MDDELKKLKTKLEEMKKRHQQVILDLNKLDDLDKKYRDEIRRLEAEIEYTSTLPVRNAIRRYCSKISQHRFVDEHGYKIMFDYQQDPWHKDKIFFTRYKFAPHTPVSRETIHLNLRLPINRLLSQFHSFKMTEVKGLTSIKKRNFTV